MSGKDFVDPNICMEFFGNKLKNGSFCTNLSQWGLVTDGSQPGSVSASVVDKQLILNDNGHTSDNISSLKLVQTGIKLRTLSSYSIHILGKSLSGIKRIQIVLKSSTLETIISHTVTLTKTFRIIKLPPFTVFTSTDTLLEIQFGGSDNIGDARIGFINMQEMR
jgi:hypothetical protein